MQPGFTEDDIILYIYDELNETDRLCVEQAIDADPFLKSTFFALLEVTGRLGTLELEPSATTIEMIMEHAHQQEEHSH